MTKLTSYNIKLFGMFQLIWFGIFSLIFFIPEKGKFNINNNNHYYTILSNLAIF